MQAERHIFNMRNIETQNRPDVARFVALLGFIPLTVVGSTALCMPHANNSYELIQASGSASEFQSTRLVQATYRKLYEPKTVLGKRLISLREQAISEGMRLLDADAIEAEVMKRRGETF